MFELRLYCCRDIIVCLEGTKISAHIRVLFLYALKQFGKYPVHAFLDVCNTEIKIKFTLSLSSLPFIFRANVISLLFSGKANSICLRFVSGVLIHAKRFHRARRANG